MQEIASLKAVIGADISDFQNGLRTVDSGMGGLIGQLGTVGAAIGGAFAVGAMIKSTADATVEFDSTLRNIQSVTELTDEALGDLAGTLLDIGANSVAGPQAVATSYSNIASAIEDADVQMSILNASIKMSEAGQASLTGSVDGMITVFNAYKLGADDAQFAMDVFSQTVKFGKDSMDQFVAAINPVAELAANLGVQFDDLGAMFAYANKQGASAAMVQTRLKAAMVAFINPNETMKDALKEMGFETGEAAIKQLGLQGALEGVNEALDGNANKFNAALGSSEAIQASTTILSEGYKQFAEDFKTSMDGVTDAMQATQLQAVDAQWTMFLNSLQAGAMGLASMALPAVNGLIGGLRGMVTDIQELGLLGALQSWFNSAVTWLQTTAPILFQSAITSAIQLGTDVATWLQTTAPNLITGFASWFTEGMTWLTSTAPLVFQNSLRAGLAFASDAVSWITENAPSILSGIDVWFNQALTWLSTEGATAFGAALAQGFTLLQDVGAWLGQNAPQLGTAIGQWVNQALDWLINDMPTAFQTALTTGIDTFVNGGGVEAALTTLQNVWSGVFGPEGFFASAIATLLGPESTIVKKFNEVFGAEGTVAKAFNQGKDWIQGFMDKAGEIAGAIVNAFAGVVDTITKPFRDALKWLGEQLVNLADSLPVLQNEVRTVGQGLINFGSASLSGGDKTGDGASFRAGGGQVFGGHPYIVGEKGMELFTPSRSGYITSADNLAGAAAGGGGINIYGGLQVYANNVEELYDEMMYEKGLRNG